VHPSPLDGRRAGDEGEAYVCPHPWPLSQFRAMGSVCSILPWVGEGLGMRGRRMLALTPNPSPSFGRGRACAPFSLGWEKGWG
jgi:hypothetical protein